MSTPKRFPVKKGQILFSAGQAAYEFVMTLEGSNHGETVLLARKRTVEGPGADVILKCVGLPDRPALDAEKTRTRLEEEVRLATYLRHPGIARVHGIKRMEGALYLIAECVDGNSLNTLSNVVPEHITKFSDAFVLYLGAEVAGALLYAHTRTDEHGKPLGIVHRAVDLERIWVTWEGQVKLTDFGLALSKLPGRIASTVQRPHGNAYYSSPEALLGKPVDARSDLFQLGLALYEVATGSHPLDPPEGLPEETEEMLSATERARVEQAILDAKETGLDDAAVEDLIVRAATYTPKDLERLVAKLSEPLRAPLRKLLQRNPTERYQTAEELEADLRAHLDRLGSYGAKEAAAEIGKVLTEVGEQLVGLEGCASPPRRQRSQDDITTG
ncbi:serine/threonine protein kinase [Hyalangium rubrum]|uniref:non-specific serine/threonine protein kinase n=1 Tax=Hyalangium rubrum TaxID=3103134 RepID=A0ABU5HAA3_9BACT|nr:serine/threonine-protein kinase [Hyalangium sp. s54d21]MDY7229753.1 serine/threonine-protein kinase [Hyalangium sp. s54d21]